MVWGLRRRYLKFGFRILGEIFGILGFGLGVEARDFWAVGLGFRLETFGIEGFGFACGLG